MDTTTILVIAGVVIAVILLMLVLVGRRPSQDISEAPPAKRPPALEPSAETVALEVPEDVSAAPVEIEPVPVVDATAPVVVPRPAKPKVGRLAQGLIKTRGVIGERLAVITRSQRLDDEDLDEIEEALIRADLGVKAATRVVDALRAQKPAPSGLREALRTELIQILQKGDPQLTFSSPGPSVWLVTGVNGVGKTTSIAKLARSVTGDGKTVVLAAADTFRAAAIDQLGTWADRVGVHMVKHASGADPGAVVFDAIEHAKARGIDVVIADTAGRLHTKTNLMEELKKVKRIAEREAGTVSEVLLVLDATVGQNGIAQARSFKEAIEVTGIILTKLDGTARGGIVVAVQEELGIPVKAIGVGEGMDDLEVFDAKAFVDALLLED